ncbi:MAG: hypothetical protein R2715_23085 [Ilumatobacteraceae bacterium]
MRPLGRRAALGLALTGLGVVGCGASDPTTSGVGTGVASSGPAAPAPVSGPADLAAVSDSLAAVPGADASASTTAGRGPAVSAGGSCDLEVAEALAERHPEVRQFVVTSTSSWSATTGRVDVAVRLPSDIWACQLGSFDAMVGRAGTRPLLDRRSGDGTTPAGVFPLGTTTAWDGQAFQFFGNGADPGVRASYRDVRRGDCWGATPGAATYNHLVLDTRCDSGDDEYLPSITGAYVHAAVIGANNEPDVSGDAPDEIPYAAAIFLHRHAYAGTSPKPTSGCVSLSLDDLVATLVTIDPELEPRFAIGPRDWLLKEA